MTMNSDKIFSWVKDFKDFWLPQNIPNNRHLFELITNKFNELEYLLNRNTQHENQSSIVNTYQYDHPNTIEQVDLSTQQAPECSLPTLPDRNNHIDENIENREQFYRPAIRIKRIPLAEAELFLPEGWKLTKSKRGRKKGQKKSATINSNANPIKKSPRKIKVPLASTQDANTSEVSNNVRKSARTKKSTKYESALSLLSIPSTNGDQKKCRRKLRAMDGEDDDLFTLGNLSQTNHTNGDIDCEQVPRFIGQNGILSQTRKLNETTTLSTFDDDFTMKSQSQKTNIDETLSNHHFNENNTHTIVPDAPVAEPMNILEDVSATEREQMYQDVVETDDNDSLFTSLELTRDKTQEPTSAVNNHSIINYNDCIEDISNDGVDPPPSSSSPNLAYFSLTT
ncbi:hypothetical protein I4U23_018855 [Adineta vaga]|nr:hypothetical protein I4U23_018855 [Adineta vaga]